MNNMIKLENAVLSVLNRVGAMAYEYDDHIEYSTTGILYSLHDAGIASIDMTYSILELVLRQLLNDGKILVRHSTFSFYRLAPTIQTNEVCIIEDE